MKKIFFAGLIIGLALLAAGCCAGQSGHVPCVPWPLYFFI